MNGRPLPPTKESGPATNGTTLTKTPDIDYTAGLRRRRAATYRLPVLDCGHHADPWTCNCDTGELSVESALAAAAHLREHGLMPLFGVSAARALWRGGHREIATMCVQQVSA